MAIKYEITYCLCCIAEESYSSLQYLYRISSQTIGKIVFETCSVIVEVLRDYLKVKKL